MRKIGNYEQRDDAGRRRYGKKSPNFSHVACQRTRLY